MSVVLVEAVPILPVSVVTVEADGVFADVALPPLPAAIVVGSGDITEAPTDGSTYGRKNGSWTAVLPLTGGVVVGDVTATRFFATNNVFIGGTTDNGYQLDVTGSGHVSSKLSVGDLLPGTSLAVNAALAVNTSGANNPHAALLYFGTASAPQYWGLAAGGTAGTPISLVLDQAIVSLGGAGFDGNLWSTTADAQISLRAAENWTATGHGSYIQVSGKATGSNALNEWARFQNGSLLIGGTASAGYKLDVVGTARFSGDMTVGGMLTVNNTSVGFPAAHFVASAGQTAPWSSVVINASGASVATLPTTPGNVLLQGVGAVSSNNRILLDAFGGFGMVTGRRAEGTPAAPSPTAANVQIAMLQGMGYTPTTGWGSSSRGDFGVWSGGLWSETSQPTYLVLRTTAVNSVTNTERARVSSAGNLLIGTTTDGTYMLDVNGPGRVASLTAGIGSQNALTITPGAAASSPIAFSQSGTGGFSFPSLAVGTATASRALELFDTASIAAFGIYLDQNDAFNFSAPAAGTTIQTQFSFLAAGAQTANTGNITTATTVTAGNPVTVSSIATDNTGLTNAQVILLTSPTPLTVGATFTVLWGTALGTMTANLTVTSSVVSGTTRTIGATGSVAASATLTPNGISYFATYSQPGGAGAAITATWSVLTNYSGTPWATIGKTGTTIAGNLVVSNASGTPNNLTIAPGVTAASAIAFTQSGTGGVSFPGLVSTPIGSTSPSTGAFTTLSATGAVSGAGFTNLLAAPGPIGSTTPNTGAFSGGKFGTASQNALTITPGAAAADIALVASGPGGVSLATPLAAGLTTTRSVFVFTAAGTLTANTSDITTAATVSGGSPFSVGTIASDNTGLVVAQNALHSSPAPVTVGGAFTVLWSTALGFYTATLTVVSSVVSGTTRTVVASGTVTGGNVGYVPNGISYIAVYTQPGGASTTISATYNIATDSALPWARVNAVGTTIYSPLAVGVPGANNVLTITPGAAATNPVAFTASGSGGISLPATAITGSLSAAGSFATKSPGAALTAATYTVAATDTALILAPTATMTLTLPAAASSGGRMLWLKLTTAFAVNSATANVVPLVGGAATTAILAATAGKVALLQSDGTNWQLMNAN